MLMQWLLVFKDVYVAGPEAFVTVLHFIVFALKIPSLIVAVLVARNVHDYSPAVVVGASVVLYSVLTYWILTSLHGGGCDVS